MLLGDLRDSDFVLLLAWEELDRVRSLFSGRDPSVGTLLTSNSILLVP
jgi:hypothetical protein